MARRALPDIARRLLDLPPSIVLMTAGLICYGGHRIIHLGFYHDDWALFKLLYFAKPGLLPRTAGLLSGTPKLLFRPLEILIYPCLYVLFGLHPLPWQLTLLAVNVLLALAVHRLLGRYGISRPLALLGALLFLAYPSKDSTMFWSTVIVCSMALLALLTGYLSHLDYVETGSRASLCLSVALLLASLLTYDNCYALFPLWLVTPRSLRDGVTPRAWTGFAAAACGVASFSIYKFWFVPSVLGIRYDKVLMLSWSHLWSTYISGIGCIAGPEAGAYVLAAFWDAVRFFPGLALAALALPWLIRERAPERPAAPARSRLCLALFGAGTFLLGYAPIAVSDYTPYFFNHMNRINQVPVLGAILMLVGLCPQSGRAAGLCRKLGCLLAGMLLAAHAAFAGYWSEAYRRQLHIRDLILLHADQWPADSTLLLLMSNNFVQNKAPVFLANWDISGAAAIWTQDPGRTANVINDRTAFLPEGVVMLPGYPALPYDSFRLLNVDREIFTKFNYGDYKRSH